MVIVDRSVDPARATLLGRARIGVIVGVGVTESESEAESELKSGSRDRAIGKTEYFYTLAIEISMRQWARPAKTRFCGAHLTRQKTRALLAFGFRAGFANFLRTCSSC